MKRASWINLILGIWLIIAPFVFGSTGLRTVTGNNIVLGILLIASSWWILAAKIQNAGVSWFQMLCGIWLVIAPFVLRYRDVTHAMANDVVVGVIVFIVGLIESQALQHRPVKTA
jgi:thiol:disulfide interchange protein